MKTLILSIIVFITLVSGLARAIPVSSKEELKGLPSFCKGTQLIRDISGDTTPFSDYAQMYGSDFKHMHHYCWALNTENKFNKNPRSMHYWGMLPAAIGDLDYVLKASSPSFVFIPDVHLAKARIYLLQKQKAKAVGAALEAIASRPDYVRAYTFLSDLYEDMGNKASAIKTLQSGYSHAPDAKPILRRLSRLGVKPIKSEVSIQPDAKNPANVTAPTIEPNPQTGSNSSTLQTSPGAPSTQEPSPANQTHESTQQASPQPLQTPPNPYCRFCP